MSRRKICLPQINVNKDISVNKEFLQGEFENLTMGEVIVNVSPENTSLIVVNEGDEPSVFEPSKNFSELFENSHQHSNKDVLDIITSDNVESWNNLIQSAHTHENKTILDGLTEDVINSWNNVIENIILNSEKLPVANKTVNIDLSDYLKEVPSEYAKTVEIQSWVNEKVDGKFDAIGSADAAEAAAKSDAAEKYQVKGEYETAGAAAQALADAKSDAAEKYQVKGEYETAGAAAAVEGKLDTHKEDTVMHVTAQERTDWNAAKSAIDTFLADADMTENAVDTLRELQSYMTTDGEAAAELINKISVLEAIDHDAYISADTQVLIDAKAYVDGKVDGKFDAAGSAAAAEAAAKADAAEKYQVKGEYEAAGAAAQALAAAKADAAEKYQVKGEYEVAGAAAQALADAKADAAEKYQVKGEYEVAGAAATAKAEAIASAKTWVEDQGYFTSIPSNYVDSDELSSELASYMTIVGAGQLSTEIYGNISASVITSVESAKTWVDSQNFLKSISLSSSTGKTYLIGKDSKTGSTTSLTTSTDDVYMEEGELYATSDERLKDFGDNISVDLDKLSEIPKAYYTWKTKPQGRKMIGLSAQKIGTLYPEVVSTDENGKMAVSYEKLSVIALAAIDELHKENEELKNRLKRIEEKLGL